MKTNILLSGVFLLPLFIIHAQSGGNQNYISIHTKMNAEGTTEQVSIQYFDGMGRPVQQVQKNHTPSGKDLVTNIDYDYCGRVSKEWLPTPVENSQEYIKPGNFATLSKAYYQDGRPYKENLYSSRYRYDYLEGIQVPGDDMDKHHSKLKHTANTANQVRKYIVNAQNRLENAGYYPPKTLECFLTTDEDGKESQIFKDKNGRIILQTSGGDVNTYHVYNSLGQPCYILPPMISDVLSAGEVSDDHVLLKQYAFIYKYDDLGNCIYKRLPGCEPIYTVYDKAGQLVFSQDGNQRKKHLWTASNYDIFGRLIYMGQYEAEMSLEEAIMEFGNSPVTDSFITTNAMGYSNTPFNLQSDKMLTVNYYDDYRFLELLPPAQRDSLSYKQKEGYGTAFTSNGSSSGSKPNAKGLLTGTRTYLLDGSGKYTIQAFYYDEKDNIIQTRQSNHLGGYTTAYHRVDFRGKPINVLKESSISGNRYGNVSELYSYTYDQAERRLTTSYRLNGNPAITLSENEYDELGRLQTTYRHNQTDTVCYKYNIRNWITQIRSGSFEENIYYNQPVYSSELAKPCYNGNISSNTWTYNGKKNGYIYFYDALNRLTSNYCYLDGLFMDAGQLSESFKYDKHGNIKEVTRFGEDDVIDLLTLSYHGNQLKKVTDGWGSGNLYNQKEYQDKANETEEFAYDANGNMVKDLDRNIVTVRYNILNLPDTVQFKNGNQIISSYDASGRRLSTRNFTLATPVVVPIGETRKWEWDFDVIDETGTFYVDNIEYDFNGCDPGVYMLGKVFNPEGYATRINSTSLLPDYHYYRKDHLGNNREVWRAAYKDYRGTIVPATTVQRIQYYPSGLPWAEGTGRNVQNRKYNGKEFIEMHGYDTYDYVARGMYPAIMSFTSVDPHAENYYNLSPYVYCGGNPISRIDPYGMDYWSTSDPVEIERFWNSLFSPLVNMLQYYSNSFNFASWDHLTDAEFTDRLTFNDENETFYFSYSKIINGEINVIGISVRATNVNQGNAWTQYGLPASGRIEQTNTVYDLLTGRFIRKAGIEMAKEAIFPGGSPTSTFGIRSGKKSTKGMPHGDGGRAMEKTKKRVKELQQKIKTAKSKKEKKELQKTIERILKDAQYKEKGETHWN